jgi:uncharacterized protein with FMN-binding domain
MRRALPALIATLGGLALLLNFHVAAGGNRRVVATSTTSTTPAAGSSPPPSGTSPRTSSTTGAGSGVRQIDGQVIPTQFGNVQVRVIVSNGTITDVRPLQMPFDHPRSEEITQAATPLLHDEVLRAQSAQIDLLSGATYTSEAYQQSLQAAVDQIRT